MDSEDKIKITANIYYCNFPKSNVCLATNLSDFKTQFINEFSLQNQLTEKDEISIYYNEEGKKEKKIEVKEQSDYQAMLQSFSNPKAIKNVYVETEKIPVFFQGDKSIEFEDEIKKVVERELRIAANKIKKCLTTNLSLSNSKKVRTQSCEGCQKQIIGYLYKKISPTENDSYYCELCSTKVDTPMFKIS